jgi:hypothetical protein
VARHVDRCDLLETEVPQQTRVDEGSDKPTRSSINVDVAVDVPLNEQVVDSLSVFVLAGVGGT